MGIDSVANLTMARLSSAYRSELEKCGFQPGWLVTLLAGVMLIGCSRGLPLQSGDQMRMVPTEQGFALPEPGGPAVTAVLEKRYANATEQDVLLATSAATPGQNMLRIQIFGPVETGLANRATLRAGYLPAKNVNAEMRELIPGVRMQTSGYYVQNKYGPFGYAVGRTSSGDTCLYAWQRIASKVVSLTCEIPSTPCPPYADEAFCYVMEITSRRRVKISGYFSRGLGHT